MIKDLKLYKESIIKVISVNKFNNLKNSKILVVGSNGLIASSIVDILHYLNINYNYNNKIIGTIRNPKKIPERFKSYKDLEIIEYDVNNKLDINVDIDYIINAASNANPIKYSLNPTETIVTCFNGTKNLLDYAINHKCKKFLYISSGEIYGQGSKDINSFDEKYAGFIDYTNPRSCYPIGKISSENLCSCYYNQFGLDVVIARPSHIYGPTQTIEDSRASAQFFNNIINDKDIVLKSDGSQIRSYCYVLDCASGILTILDRGLSGEAYNVSNNHSIISIKELALTIANYCNKKVVFELPSDVEKKGYNKVTRSVLDGSKLESLGWICLFNIKDGVKNTIDIMK